MPQRRKQPDFTETTVRPDKTVEPPPMEDGEAVSEKVRPGPRTPAEEEPGRGEGRSAGGLKGSSQFPVIGPQFSLFRARAEAGTYRV